MKQQMENSVIDEHIQNSACQRKKQREIFFPDDQQGAKKHQKTDVEINIKRIEYPLRNNFHCFPPFVRKKRDKSDAVIVTHEE